MDVAEVNQGTVVQLAENVQKASVAVSEVSSEASTDSEKITKKPDKKTTLNGGKKLVDSESEEVEEVEEEEEEEEGEEVEETDEADDESEVDPIPKKGDVDVSMTVIVKTKPVEEKPEPVPDPEPESKKPIFVSTMEESDEPKMKTAVVVESAPVKSIMIEEQSEAIETEETVSEREIDQTETETKTATQVQPTEQVESDSNRPTEIQQENIKQAIKEIISDIDRSIAEQQDERRSSIKVNEPQPVPVAQSPISEQVQAYVSGERVQQQKQIARELLAATGEQDEGAGIPKTSIDLQKIFTPASDAEEIIPHKNRKLYASSAFFAPGLHPTVEDQVELARRISSSLSDISNQKSKGQSMYVNRKKRSVKWVHEGEGQSDQFNGYSTQQYSESNKENDNYKMTTTTKIEQRETNERVTTTTKIPLKLVMDPRGQLQDIDTLRNQQPEYHSPAYYQQYEPQQQGRITSPERDTELLDALHAPRGKGAELFAKRRKRSEKWIVDETTTQSALAAAARSADDFDGDHHVTETERSSHVPVPTYTNVGVSRTAHTFDQTQTKYPAPRMQLKSPWTSATVGPTTVYDTEPPAPITQSYVDATETYTVPTIKVPTEPAYPIKKYSVTASSKRDLAYRPSIPQGWNAPPPNLPRESEYKGESVQKPFERKPSLNGFGSDRGPQKQVHFESIQNGDDFDLVDGYRKVPIQDLISTFERQTRPVLSYKIREDKLPDNLQQLRSDLDHDYQMDWNGKIDDQLIAETIDCLASDIYTPPEIPINSYAPPPAISQYIPPPVSQYNRPAVTPIYQPAQNLVAPPSYGTGNISPQPYSPSPIGNEKLARFEARSVKAIGNQSPVPFGQQRSPIGTNTTQPIGPIIQQTDYQLSQPTAYRGPVYQPPPLPHQIDLSQCGNHNRAARGWGQTRDYYRPITFTKPRVELPYTDF